MTEKTNPSPNRQANPELTAAAIRWGGGTEGFVVDDSTDIMATRGGLTGAPLNAFDSSHSGASLTVTIDTGEAFVGGAWLGKDTTTNVSLSASTNNQTVYVGWDVSQGDNVIIGLSGAFASADPKIEIWEYDTNGSGVTSATDQRVLSQQIQDHAAQHKDGGTDELDASELAGAVGNSGDLLQSDGAASSWVAQNTIDAADLGGSSGNGGEVLKTDGSNAVWGHYGAFSTDPDTDWTQHSLTNITADADLVNIGSGSGWFLGGIAQGRGLISAVYTVDGNTSETISDDIWEIGAGDNVGIVSLPPVRYESSLVIAINVDEGELDGTAAMGVTIQE